MLTTDEHVQENELPAPKRPTPPTQSPPSSSPQIPLPETDLQSPSAPTKKLRRKSSYGVLQLCDIKVSLHNVANTLSKSFRKRNLDKFIAPTILDIVPDEVKNDRKVLVKFMEETCNVSRRTVERALRSPSKSEQSSSSPSHPADFVATMDIDQPPQLQQDHVDLTGQGAVHELQENASLTPPPTESGRDSGSDLLLERGGSRVGRPHRRTLEAIRSEIPEDNIKLIALLSALERISNVQSGSDGDRHLCRATWKSGYLDYMEDLKEHGLEEFRIGEVAFRKWCRKWNVKLFRHDRYACPHCQKANSGAIPKTDPAYVAHRFLVEGMHEIYHKLRESLADPEAVLVILDYCRHHAIDATSVPTSVKLKSDPQRYKKANMKTSHLSATIVTQPWAEVGHCTDVHIDVIGQVKQGPAFMNAGMQHIIDYLQQNLPERRKVHFFADGGLRTWGTLERISSVSAALDGIDVDAHYFASYHGHNPCDAHFGQIKIKIKREGKQGMLHPNDLIRISKSIPRTHVHEIPSTTPPLETAFQVKQLTLSHYQSFKLKRVGDRITITAYQLGELFGNSTGPYTVTLGDPQPVVRTPVVRPNIGANDDDNDDDFLIFDDDDSVASDDEDDDGDDAFLDDLEFSDMDADILVQAAPRKAIDMSEIFDTMAGIPKSGDAYHFLTSFVTERGALDSILGLWKLHGGKKRTAESTKLFIDEANAVLNSRGP